MTYILWKLQIIIAYKGYFCIEFYNQNLSSKMSIFDDCLRSFITYYMINFLFFIILLTIFIRLTKFFIHIVFNISSFMLSRYFYTIILQNSFTFLIIILLNQIWYFVYFAPFKWSLSLFFGNNRIYYQYWFWCKTKKQRFVLVTLLIKNVLLLLI